MDGAGLGAARLLSVCPFCRLLALAAVRLAGCLLGTLTFRPSSAFI